MESKEMSNALGVVKKSLCQLESVSHEALHEALSKLGCVENIAKNKNGVEIGVIPEISTPSPEKILDQKSTPTPDEDLREKSTPSPDESLREKSTLTSDEALCEESTPTLDENLHEKSTPSPSDKDSFDLYLSEESFEENTSVNGEHKTETSNESRLPEEVGKEFKEMPCQRLDEICNKDCTGESYQASSVANEPVDKESPDNTNCSFDQEILPSECKNLKQAVIKRSTEACEKDADRKSPLSYSFAKKLLENDADVNCNVDHRRSLLKPDEINVESEKRRQETNDSPVKESCNNINRNVDQGNSHLRTDLVVDEKIKEAPQKPDIIIHSSMASSENSSDLVHANSVHANSADANSVHANSVHAKSVHANLVHANSVHANSVHVNTSPLSGLSIVGSEKVNDLREKIRAKFTNIKTLKGLENENNAKMKTHANNNDVKSHKMGNVRQNGTGFLPIANSSLPIRTGFLIIRPGTSTLEQSFLISRNKLASFSNGVTFQNKPIGSLVKQGKLPDSKDEKSDSLNVKADSMNCDLTSGGGMLRNACISKANSKDKMPCDNQTLLPVAADQAAKNFESCGVAKGKNTTVKGNETSALENECVVLKSKKQQKVKRKLSKHDKSQEKQGRVSKRRKAPKKDCNFEWDKVLDKKHETGKETPKDGRGTAKGIEGSKSQGLEGNKTQGLEGNKTTQGLEGNKTQGLEGNKTQGLEGNKTQGLEGNKTQGLEGNKTQGLEGNKTQGLEGNKTQGLEGNKTQGLQSNKTQGLEGNKTTQGLEGNKTQGHGKGQKEKGNKKVSLILENANPATHRSKQKKKQNGGSGTLKVTEKRVCSTRLAEKKKKRDNMTVPNEDKVLNKETTHCSKSVSSEASDTSRGTEDNVKGKSLDNLSLVIGKQNCGKIQNIGSTKNATFAVLNKDKSSDPSVTNGISDNRQSSMLSAGDQGIILLRISGNQVKVFKNRKDILQTVGNKKRSYVLKTSIGAVKAVPRADEGLDKLGSSSGPTDLGLSFKEDPSSSDAATTDFAVQCDHSDSEDRNEVSEFETLTSTGSLKLAEKEINKINKKIASYKKKTYKHKNHPKTTMKCKACRYSTIINQFEAIKTRLETKQNASQGPKVDGNIDINDTQDISVTECPTAERTNDKPSAVEVNQEHEITDRLDCTAAIVKSKEDNEKAALREEQAVSDNLESCDVVSIDRDLAKQVADYVEKTVTSESFSSSPNCAVPVESDTSLTVEKEADCGECLTAKRTSKEIEEASGDVNVLDEKEPSIDDNVIRIVQPTSNESNDKGIVTKPIVTGLSSTNSKSFVLLSVIAEDDMNQAENDVTNEKRDSIEKSTKAEEVNAIKCMRETNKVKSSESDTTNSSDLGLDSYLSNTYAWKNIFYDDKLVGRKRKLHESCPIQFAWENPHCFSSRRFIYDKVTVLDKLHRHEVRMQRYKEVKIYNREELYADVRKDDASRGKASLSGYRIGSTKAGSAVTTSPNGLKHVTELNYSHESQSISEKTRKRQRRSEGLTDQEVAELLEYRASKGLVDPCVASARTRDIRMEKDAVNLGSCSNGVNKKKKRKRRRVAKQDKPFDIRESVGASPGKALLRRSREKRIVSKPSAEVKKEKDEHFTAESDRITETVAYESASEASPKSASYCETLTVEESSNSKRRLPRKCKQRSNEASARNIKESLLRKGKEKQKTKDSLLGKRRKKKKIIKSSSRKTTNDEALNEASTEKGFDIMIKTEPEDANNQDEAFGISIESLCNVRVPISAIDPCELIDMCDFCDKVSSSGAGQPMLSSNSQSNETEKNSSSRESIRALRPRKAKTERLEIDESEENSIVESREVDNSVQSDLLSSNLPLGERENEACVNESREENLGVDEVKKELADGNNQNVELDSASVLQSVQLEPLGDVVQNSLPRRARNKTHRGNLTVLENEEVFDQEASILPGVDKSGSQKVCQPKKRRKSRNKVTENSPSSRYHGVLRNRSIKSEIVEGKSQGNAVDTVIKTEHGSAECLNTNEELNGNLAAGLADENLTVQRSAEKPKQKHKVGLTRGRPNKTGNKVAKKSIESSVVESPTCTISNEVEDSNVTRKRRKRRRKLREMNCSDMSDRTWKSSTNANESMSSESHIQRFDPKGKHKDNNVRRRSRRVRGSNSKERKQASGSSISAAVKEVVQERSTDIIWPIPEKDPYSLSEMPYTVSKLLSTVTESLNEKSSPSRNFLPCEKCGKFYKCKKEFARHYLHHVIDEAADKEFEDVWSEIAAIPSKRCRIDDSSGRSENSALNNQNDNSAAVLTEKCKLSSGTGATKITYKANYWQLEKPHSIHRKYSSRDKTAAVWTPVNFKVPVKPVKWKCSRCKKKYRRLHELKLHTDVCTGKKSTKERK